MSAAKTTVRKPKGNRLETLLAQVPTNVLLRLGNYLTPKDGKELSELLKDLK